MTSPLRHRIAAFVVATILSAIVPFAATPASAATVVATGVTSASLQSVAFLNASTGFVAADNGAILKTTDGGENWTQVRAADSYSFRGIDFWDGTKGVAVDFSGKVAKTTDGGNTWVNVDFTPYPTMDGNVTPPATRTHNDVACQKGGTGVTVAAGDDIWDDDTWTEPATMGATSSNLRWWQNPFSSGTTAHTYLLDPEFAYAGRGEFLDVEYSTTATIWAAGVDYWPIPDPYNTEKYPLFKSTNGGISYTPVTGFGSTDLRLEGVSFGSPSVGITVGRIVGGNRVAYATSDGGATWTPAVTLPGTDPLMAVYMTSATQAWAVDDHGGIVRTTDAGAHWAACTITDGNTNALYDVEFIKGTTTGWAVGAAGTLLLTTDGATWHAPTAPADTTPPAAPTGLAASGISSTSIRLNWSPTSDPSGISRYTVYTSTGTKIADVASGTTYTVTGLAPSTAYSYYVTATDGADNESAPSNTASATTNAVPVTLMPVFRFYNFTNGTHFFTPSETERDTVIATWPNVFRYEGIAYYTNPANNTQPLYRFYNKVSGSHFYTASADEANTILAKWPNVFSLDGQTYAVCPSPVPNSIPVYRFFNRTNGSHFYTASADERDTVIARWSNVYTFEGPAFYLGQ